MNTPVTQLPPPHFRDQIGRIISSKTLHGSESLRKLLSYLAEQTFAHPGVPSKEYQIATEVFGREPNFDPKLDAVVRVQAGRLRSKLIEYYSGEGARDRVLVELPKGVYALEFHPRRGSPSRSSQAETLGELKGEVRPQPSLRKWIILSVVLGAGMLAAMVAVAVLVLARKPVPPTNSGPQVPQAIRTFWEGFRTSPVEPWVVFSNASFVGRPNSGMRYYDAARDKGQPILDHYTGVGEVLAVHNLDMVFSSLHEGLGVKRGNLFSLDDAKTTDLILIGSPSENLTLLEIPNTREFVFRRVAKGAQAGSMEIINTHPQPGELNEYLASPPNAPLVEEYSVVALVKGVNPSHSELILAGTTTIGTQAAVEFVTRESSLTELLKRLDVSKPTDLKPFEAVIHVKVARGVPVGSEIVAIRKLKF